MCIVDPRFMCASTSPLAVSLEPLAVSLEPLAVSVLSPATPRSLTLCLLTRVVHLPLALFYLVCVQRICACTHTSTHTHTHTHRFRRRQTEVKWRGAMMETPHQTMVATTCARWDTHIHTLVPGGIHTLEGRRVWRETGVGVRSCLVRQALVSGGV